MLFIIYSKSPGGGKVYPAISRCAFWVYLYDENVHSEPLLKAFRIHEHP